MLVRELAARLHAGPGGKPVRVARGTIDRWIRRYRSGGFEALAPVARDGEPVTDKAVLDLAAALKLEMPRRTAAQAVSYTHLDVYKRQVQAWSSWFPPITQWPSSA